MKARLVVFSPHPDDETLACGGTITKTVHQGDDVYIVTMTDGRNSHRIVLRIDKNPTPQEIGAIRKNEARQAAEILGVKQDHLFFLDFEDGSLDHNISEAKEQVKDILIKLNPDKIFVPSERDIHKDHRATNVIVSLALEELALQLNVYAYVVWSDRRMVQRILEKLHEILRPPSVMRIRISDFLELKRKAISMYKSQVSLLFPSQQKPILDETFLSSFVRPTECFLVKPIRRETGTL